MKKEIKDYLHLYLGCEVQPLSNKSIWQLFRISLLGVSIKSELGVMIPEDFNSIKPILRPLSDMTNEEQDFQFDNFINIKVIDQQVVAEEIKWLLSKHFDLFNLIPEGLAIDKTTISK